MTGNGPVLTATGNKEVDAVVPILLASPNNVISNPGYPAVTTASGAIRAAERQVRLQAAVLRHEHLRAGQT